VCVCVYVGPHLLLASMMGGPPPPYGEGRKDSTARNGCQPGSDTAKGSDAHAVAPGGQGGIAHGGGANAAANGAETASKAAPIATCEEAALEVEAALAVGAALEDEEAMRHPLIISCLALGQRLSTA
jgi:hypothetical protein